MFKIFKKINNFRFRMFALSGILTLLVLLGLLVQANIKPIEGSFGGSEEFYLKKSKYVFMPKRVVFSEDPQLTAQSVFVMDMGTGEVLLSKNPDLPSLPASTTKIITAMVAKKYIGENKILKVPPEAVRIEGQKIGLIAGEEMYLEDLLYAILISSANDAAETIAYNFEGGRDEFIKLMNQEAVVLGARNSNFLSPSGLDYYGQFTTSKDLAVIAKNALNEPIFAQAVSTKELKIESIDGKNTHQLVNINKLLGEVNGVLGVKTGWTENAMENLVTYVDRDGKSIIISLLGSQDRFGETKKIIDFIYTSYDWKMIDRYDNSYSEIN
jgi:serine-type D-Ala-D-Ala carboxypeptidase (penicillin-binding protein 5/6)